MHRVYDKLDAEIVTINADRLTDGRIAAVDKGSMQKRLNAFRFLGKAAFSVSTHDAAQS
jgi:hypothetical protein